MYVRYFKPGTTYNIGPSQQQFFSSTLNSQNSRLLPLYDQCQWQYVITQNPNTKNAPQPQDPNQPSNTKNGGISYIGV